MDILPGCLYLPGRLWSASCPVHPGRGVSGTFRLPSVLLWASEGSIKCVLSMPPNAHLPDSISIEAAVLVSEKVLGDGVLKKLCQY